MKAGKLTERSRAGHLGADRPDSAGRPSWQAVVAQATERRHRDRPARVPGRRARGLGPDRKVKPGRRPGPDPQSSCPAWTTPALIGPVPSRRATGRRPNCSRRSMRYAGSNDGRRRRSASGRRGAAPAGRPARRELRADRVDERQQHRRRSGRRPSSPWPCSTSSAAAKRAAESAGHDRSDGRPGATCSPRS